MNCASLETKDLGDDAQELPKAWKSQVLNLFVISREHGQRDRHGRRSSAGGRKVVKEESGARRLCNLKVATQSHACLTYNVDFLGTPAPAVFLSRALATGNKT